LTHIFKTPINKGLLDIGSVFHATFKDKLDKILERIDRRIDESMRMFTFAMTFSAISMIGLVGKMLKLF